MMTMMSMMMMMMMMMNGGGGDGDGDGDDCDDEERQELNEQVLTESMSFFCSTLPASLATSFREKTCTLW